MIQVNLIHPVCPVLKSLHKWYGERLSTSDKSFPSCYLRVYIFLVSLTFCFCTVKSTAVSIRWSKPEITKHIQLLLVWFLVLCHFEISNTYTRSTLFFTSLGLRTMSVTKLPEFVHILAFSLILISVLCFQGVLFVFDLLPVVVQQVCSCSRLIM